MTPIQLLSAAHWGSAFLLLAAPLVFVILGSPLEPVLMGAALCLLLAAPHLYLALNVEKGRGRGLETVLSVLSLGAFPIGTFTGALGLWVCWFGETRALFDDPSSAESPMNDGPDLPPYREGETAWTYGSRLKAAGFDAQEIAQGLQDAEFDDDAVETTLGALQLGRKNRPPGVRRASPEVTPVRGSSPQRRRR